MVTFSNSNLRSIWALLLIDLTVELNAALSVKYGPSLYMYTCCKYDWLLPISLSIMLHQYFLSSRLTCIMMLSSNAGNCANNAIKGNVFDILECSCFIDLLRENFALE